MNWVLAVGAVIIIGNCIAGIKRGFVKTVFSFFTLLIAIGLTIWLSPYVSKWMRGNESINQYCTEKVEEILDIDPRASEKRDSEAFISSLELPNFIEGPLLENNQDEIYGMFEVAKDDVKGYVIKSVTSIVINAIGFIVTFIIVRLLLWLLVFVLDIISHLPVLKQVNSLLGFLLGLLQGLAFVWLLCILLTAISGTSIGKEVFVQLNDSKIMSFIYNNNLLLKVVTNFPKLLYLVRIF